MCVVSWVVGVFVGFLVCCVCLVFCLVVCLVLCCLSSRSFPVIAPSHKRCEAYFCLSEWALDWLWRLMSLVTSALLSCFSLAMDCLYPRDPPQPVRKKKPSSSRKILSIVITKTCGRLPS